MSLTIEYVPTDKLVPYARNSRTHSQQQVAEIAASIREFGFTNPVLVDAEGTIIAGHGRLQAAMALQLPEVPTICLGHLSEAQRRAYVIADNKLALNAGWDMEMLANEVRSIEADIDAGLVDFDLDILGFSDDELRDMLAPLEDYGSDDDADDEDVIPDLPEEAVARPGDVWLLGPHRVICGDSTDADVVAKALDGDKPRLMVTDPPYGVEYDPAWRNKAGAATTKRTGKVLNDDRADWREAWALFGGDIVYVWSADRTAGQVIQSLEASGFIIRQQIIWAKSMMTLSRAAYHFKHEPCWYAVRKGANANWSGGRKQTTLWTLGADLSEIANEVEEGHDKDDAATVHGTQKPVELMRRPMMNHTQAGEVVYDPFLGSGSTIIAAASCSRVAIGCELDPRYVDVIIRRWEAWTKKTATLEEDGRSFTEVAAAR